MHAFAQWITPAQQPHQLLGKGLNDRDLQSEPRVFTSGGKRFALAQKRAGAPRKSTDTCEKAGRCPLDTQLGHTGASIGKDAERNIDAAAIAVIYSATLQAIVDLQRCSYRI